MVDTFSTPYVQKIVEQVQSEDFAFIYHNCGNTLPLMESIKRIPAYGYHFGNAVDIEKILPLVSPGTIVMGNIDPSSQFRNGTPDSIYQKTTEILHNCTRFSNFIISSGCDIPPLSPWDNIDAFFKAVADFYR